MAKNDALMELEGLQTVETAMEKLGISKQATINLLSRLKKEGHVTANGGGKQKRIYKVTMTKQRKRSLGMFDIINKYSPMKILPWYDHQVHGNYGAEEAIIDAIETQSFRVILASMRIFNHVNDWPKLYALAKEKGVWQKVGALYDLAKLHFRVRKMPEKYSGYEPVTWMHITKLHNRNNFPTIQKKWKVFIPFNEKDMGSIEW